MKKSILFIILMAGLVSMARGGIAAETKDDSETDKALATVKTSESSPEKELPKSKRETLEKEAVAADEAKLLSVVPASSAVKEKTGKTEAAVSKASHEVLPEKKATESKVKAEDFSSLNSVEMQRRWKNLFSKEITPDSIAYTVKSGDRLYVLALKNHTTADLIKKINNLKSDNIYPGMKLKIHTAPFLIRIDKSKNILVLYSEGEAVKKYSVATGKKNCTPVGEFKIMDKLVHPTWFKTGAILPPGSPENALGTRWMGFDKPAYGIHGTIEPKSIGTQASEGCVRMLNEEVEELYSIVPVGTKVIIQD